MRPRGPDDDRTGLGERPPIPPGVARGLGRPARPDDGDRVAAAIASTEPRTTGRAAAARSEPRWVRGVLGREDLDARDLDPTEHRPGILGDRRDRPGRRRVERFALIDDAGLDEPPGRARP
jgi:hypothetical protein